MWLMLDTGFISIVEHQDDPSVLLVRSRIKADITSIFGDQIEVEEKVGADYLYRAEIDRELVASVMWEKVMTLDYTSHVKDVAIRRSAPAQGRSAAYYATWSAMAKMQPIKPYAGKSWGTGTTTTGFSSGLGYPQSTARHRPAGTSRWEYEVDDDRESVSTGAGFRLVDDGHGGVRTITEAEEEATAAEETAVVREVTSDVPTMSVCTRNVDAADIGSVCDECGHTTLLHPGPNDIDACIACEIEEEAFAR